MNNKKQLWLVVGLLVIVLAGAGLLYTQLSGLGLSVQSADAGSEEERTPAPDFTVYDKNGGAVKLSDYVGTPVVINFWASWCGPCQSEMPEFEEKYQELGKSVQFLMVNMTDGSRETKEKASQFIEENGYTFPVYYDTDSEAASAYGARSLPTTYFVDKDGNAVARAVGAIDADTLQKGIDMIV